MINAPLQDLRTILDSTPLLDAKHPEFSSRVIDCEWLASMKVRGAKLLKQLEADATPLVNAVSTRAPKRLGHYFETLIGFWLSNLPGIVDLVANQVVVQNGRSVGEMDLLFFDTHVQKVFHLELAVKYYLKRHRSSVKLLETPQLEDYWGPNGNDRLSYKLKRIFEHQLCWPKTDVGQNAMPPQWKDYALTSQAWMHGGLFYPLGEWLDGLNSSDWPYPKGIVPSAPQGWWVEGNGDGLSQLQGLDIHSWCLLPRLCWLSKQVRSNSDISAELLPSYMENHFAQGGSSVLIAGWQKGVNDLESTRGFIVRPGWHDLFAKN